MSEKDIQDQIEFMVKRFQEAINKFDAFEKKIKDAVDLSNNLSLKVSDIANKHANLEEITINFPKVVKDTIQSSFKSFISLKSDVESLINERDANKQKLGDVSIQANSALAKCSDLESKVKSFANLSVVDEVKKCLKNLEDKILSNHLIHQDSIVGLASSHIVIKNIVDAVNADLKIAKAKIDDNAASLKNVAADVGLGKQFSQNLFGSLKDDMLNQIKKSISDIPKPLIPSLDDAKKAMETKIEPISLDARNAQLRSVNNEQKILILEKKVEQLQLLLNKLQLQG